MDYIKAVEEFGGKRPAARALNMPESTLRKRVKEQEKAQAINKLGLRINDPEEVIPAGMSLERITVGKKTEEGMIWLKAKRDEVEARYVLESLASTLMDEIEPIPPIEFKGQCQSNLCSAYIISDFHLGQYSSLSEVGEEWDLEIAESLIKKWIDNAVFSSPRSEQAVLVDLGDFLHADGLLPLTPASKHVLDASGRFHEAIDAATRIFDYMINVLLAHHERVHVIIAEGNHNESSAHWMVRLIARKYENEPRLTFDRSDLPYYAFEWGNTGLFFHHGHKKRINLIAETLAGQFNKIFGNTEYRYAHVGHLHHKEVKESQLMVVEQHSTLAAKDAYSARGGYHSQRGASVITYHKDFGEVSRNTLRPEMIL